MEWLPIETAPNDGETVLTIHKDDLFPVTAFCIGGEWLRTFEGPEDVWSPGKWEPLFRPPTHWMPLPTPPSSSP